MLQFKDMVLRMKNLVKMQNVYDCVRPILFVLRLFGVGASNIMKVDGVYSVHNTRYSTILAIITSILTPLWIGLSISKLFSIDYIDESYGRPIGRGVLYVTGFLNDFLRSVTVSLGYIMTTISYKDLDKVFQIINNIDNKLEQRNIYIKHWKITLAVTVLGLVTADYTNIAWRVYFLIQYEEEEYDDFNITAIICHIIYYNLLHLYYVWVILLLLIIYERLVSINKLFVQNARVTNIRIIGSRNLRDDYLLRRISVARYLDEQLSEAIVIYSNVFRYMIVGLLLYSIVETLFSVIFVLFSKFLFTKQIKYTTIFIHCMRLLILHTICQAYKEERRVLTVRLRHLISHETDRRIIQQVQQYIMYTATSVPGVIDFQFTGVDNTLLFTIIDVIISNVLIIYSYAR